MTWNDSARSGTTPAQLPLERSPAWTSTRGSPCPCSSTKRLTPLTSTCCPSAGALTVMEDPSNLCPGIATVECLVADCKDQPRDRETRRHEVFASSFGQVLYAGDA